MLMTQMYNYRLHLEGRPQDIKQFQKSAYLSYEENGGEDKWISLKKIMPIPAELRNVNLKEKQTAQLLKKYGCTNVRGWCERNWGRANDFERAGFLNVEDDDYFLTVLGEALRYITLIYISKKFPKIKFILEDMPSHYTRGFHSSRGQVRNFREFCVINGSLQYEKCGKELVPDCPWEFLDD